MLDQGVASARVTEQLQAAEQQLAEMQREVAAARAAMQAAENRLQVGGVVPWELFSRLSCRYTSVKSFSDVVFQSLPCARPLRPGKPGSWQSSAS